MKRNKNFFGFWSRKLHRWGTMVVAVPLLVIIVSGVILQWKKQFDWIQPPTQRGASADAPLISFEQILEAARTAEPADIRTWEDVDRLDVRPGKGIAKVTARENGWEVQVDLQTAQVMHVAQRRSDFIEAIHDGSWFHERAKLWVFFPVTMITLVLLLTGVYLFYLPYKTRRKRASEPQIESV